MVVQLDHFDKDLNFFAKKMFAACWSDTLPSGSSCWGPCITKTLITKPFES